MRKNISLFLAVFLTFAFAQSSFAVYDPNAKQSKWYVDRLMADPTLKATVEIKAQRNYPVSTLGADGKPIIQSKVQKSTIKLAPKAANVGKSLIKRAPAIAITQAVVALLGKAVDWLLDPENNRVKYKDPDAGSGSPDSAATYDAECKRIALKTYGTSEGASIKEIHPDGGQISCNTKYGVIGWFVFSLPAHVPDPNAPTANDWQYIPIDQVASKVIEQANAGQAPAMEVMSNAALDQLEEGLLDAQLEAAAESKVFNEGESDPTDPNAPNPDPNAPTDPNAPNPDAKPFELPPFCSWAVKVCDFIDWVQTEPAEPEESGDIEVQKPDPVIHEDLLERLYINMPAQCPPDPVLEFMGARIPFPMSVFCQFAVMMKPLILLFAYIKGLAIIGNGLS